MSEYQYYEFLAIDRPLTAEERASVQALSRRVQPTATRAVFTYSYGDFPGEPLELLAKHYDAMLYMANWGSKQLAFRFPKAALDRQALAPYTSGVEQIELTDVGEYVVLSIGFYEEEGLGWLAEDDAQLAQLAPLRDDLMRGDLRALYLLWLAAVDDDPKADELIEPPVPPGLGQLSAPLRALVEFFLIDQDLVDAAAAGSPALKAAAEPLERWVPLLPEAERTSFLVRAARGESIGLELLRRLRQVGRGASPMAAQAPRRSMAALLAVVGEVRRQRIQHEHEQAERARLARFDELASREEQLWARIPPLLARRTAGSYDEAVRHLVELRGLAIHRGQLAAFGARLSALLAPSITSAALQRRLREKHLLEP